MNLLVVTPTYNERENLPVLVTGILKYDGARILVVDDGSPDGTGAIADRLAMRCSLVSRGIPVALELGPTANPLLASQASRMHPTTSPPASTCPNRTSAASSRA